LKTPTTLTSRFKSTIQKKILNKQKKYSSPKITTPTTNTQLQVSKGVRRVKQVVKQVRKKSSGLKAKVISQSYSFQ